jgi:predicted esterase
MRHFQRPPARTLHAAVLLLLGLLPPAGQAQTTKESLTVYGQQRRFFLLAPDPLPPSSAPAPLILLLHGSGRDGNSLLKPWAKLASREGIILVAPNASNPQVWRPPIDGPEFLIKAVEAARKKLPVDPSRIYLFGHSAGAVFALLVSFAESQYFAAAAVHAGALRQPDEIATIEWAKRKLPIQLLIGTRDPFFPIDAVRRTRELLEAKQFPVDLQEISGHDHDYYGIAAKINEQAWSFLKDKTLPAPPRSEFQGN